MTKKYFYCIDKYDDSKFQRIPSITDEKLGINTHISENKHKITKRDAIEEELYDIQNRKDITLQRHNTRKVLIEPLSRQVSKHTTKQTRAKAGDYNKGQYGYIQWKRNKQQRESSANTELESGAKLSNENQIVSDDNGEKESGESDTKYLQILFYYVQDAVLFKVKLPTDNVSKTESFIVKILQFSPEIFAVYTNYSDICFTYGGSAVSKMTMKSVLGPCVILFLLLV